MAWGGHVTSIVNQEERDHVRRIAGNQTVWIGARRHGGGNGPGPNHWLWVDGTRWEYTAWERGEPNNAGGREDRVQMYGHNGHWNDVHSGWGGRAVYKKRAAPVMTEEDRRRHAWMQGAFEPLLTRLAELELLIFAREDAAAAMQIRKALEVRFTRETALPRLIALQEAQQSLLRDVGSGVLYEPPRGLVAWFKGEQFEGGKWPDELGNTGQVTTGVAQKSTCAGHGATHAVTAVSGSSSCAFSFGHVVKLQFYHRVSDSLHRRCKRSYPAGHQWQLASWPLVLAHGRGVLSPLEHCE